MTLIAMRRRPDGDPSGARESAAWLEAMRRRLAPCMPLGTRLAVVAPRYTEFSLRATIESEPGRDPADIDALVTKELERRLAILDRPPGVPVSHRDVAAWLRQIEGVQRIAELELLDAGGRAVEEVRVTPGGLPLWQSARSAIKVKRSTPARSR